MFKVDDTVVYGTAGVCVISEIREMEICGSTADYYVLKPVDSKASQIFVP